MTGLEQSKETAGVFDVAEDEMINYDDVALPKSVALELRWAQDAGFSPMTGTG